LRDAENMASLIDGYCCLINKQNSSIWTKVSNLCKESSKADDATQKWTIKRGLTRN
jgi:hypothetical protein